MAHLQTEASNCSLLLIYLLQKDERLSRPGWLTYSVRFTHISGHPSAAVRAQDSESWPVRDRRSTAVPRNQPKVGTCVVRPVIATVVAGDGSWDTKRINSAHTVSSLQQLFC